MKRILLALLLAAVPSSASNLGTTDPASEIARGNRGNDYVVNKFGFNEDLDAPLEVVSTHGDYWQPTSASTLEVISGDADDTAAGTGCQNVCIQGLNNSWVDTTECEDTAGASASTATTASFFRVYRAWCDRTGTYGGNNEGLVTVRISSAGATVGQITAGDGQSLIAAYTVQAGYSCYMRSYFMQTNEATSTLIGNIYKTVNVNDVATAFDGAKRLSWRGVSIGKSGLGRAYGMPVKFSEYTDITCEFSGGSNSEASCNFELECIED